jgi:uncharacterized protein (DUF111 family)
MQLLKIGSGAGGKDFDDCPNILRAFLGEQEVVQQAADDVIVVETNIDDSTPEVLGYVMERLLEAGGLDVFFTSIQMKKNRPATQLSFLCRPEQLEFLSSIVLSETSAIGLRHYPAGRTILERRIEERETGFGRMKFKAIYNAEKLLREAPEYEDCRRVARETGLPLQEVMKRVASGCA